MFLIDILYKNIYICSIGNIESIWKNKRKTIRCDIKKKKNIDSYLDVRNDWIRSFRRWYIERT